LDILKERGHQWTYYIYSTVYDRKSSEMQKTWHYFCPRPAHKSEGREDFKKSFLNAFLGPIKI
jgi:hypothetical protein